MNLQNLQADIAEAIYVNDNHNDLVFPAENIAIYQSNMQTALTRALKVTYTMLLKIIGEDCFNVLARDYIISYPSVSGDLNEYGEYLNIFLENYAALQNLPYLSEVARFEWTCHCIGRMAEPLPFDIKILQQIATDQYSQLHFSLSPTCTIDTFQYPILRLIALCKNEIPGPIDLNEGGVNLLIFKKQQHLSLVALSEGELIFLNALQENKSLSDALDLALDKEVTFKLDEKLLIWIKNRIIIDCNVEVT